MSNAPLMPKATAVWLVDNTALTFDQVAEFTKMHPLEIRAIADGDAAQGIKGMDPISTGQLSREEIERGEADPDYRLKLGESKVILPEAKKKKGPRYTPVSRRHERPSAILWLVRNHPELKDSQIMRLVGTALFGSLAKLRRNRAGIDNLLGARRCAAEGGAEGGQGRDKKKERDTVAHHTPIPLIRRLGHAPSGA